MNGLIDWCFAHSRTVLIGLLLILTTGGAAYVAIPKESMPDVSIPIIYVSVGYDGITPEDGERLLLRPLETQLQSVEGLRTMNSTAAVGYANLILEFDAGGDTKVALDDVRDAVDQAQSQLPAGADEPVVREINTADFPVLSVMISGPVPERALVAMADDLENRIEAIQGVLEVDIGGKRDETLEVLIDSAALEGYDISFESLLNQVQRNNRLVAAGAIDTGAGRLTLKVPGVIETVQDVAAIPVKVEGSAVVTLADIALVRRTFRDPTGFARINGEPALALEIKKRVGANIIETVGAVRDATEAARAGWPDTVQVTYMQDQSEQVENLLGDLQNNVLSAIVLVMVVVIAALGLRNGILVGLAIPGSFLAGIAMLYAMGTTMNIIVLFSLILVVGMLVDAAIVTLELADRRLAEGVPAREAYAAAAKRMSWPIISSTATTLAVFVPLLFWGGMVGEFMRFLPMTVLLTLSASLAMALLFIPVLGGMIGKPGATAQADLAALRAAETGDLAELRGFTRSYVRVLSGLVAWPRVTFMVALVLLVATYVAYGSFGRGVTFFPSVEPEVAQVQITARDSLSIWEKDALVRQVEARMAGLDGIEHVYARTIGEGGGDGTGSPDVIGILQLDFLPWEERRTAAAILDDVRARTADIAGIGLLAQEQQMGPTQGKPVQLRLTSKDAAAFAPATATVLDLMDRIGGFRDIEDTLTRPGVEWSLDVDRAEAARYGADITTLGQAVQLLTAGMHLADYRPEDASDEVEIRVRFPADQRNLERLQHLRLSTPNGLIPISNFVELRPVPRTGTINRIDGQRTVSIDADVAEGLLVSDQIATLQRALAETDLPGVSVSFAGEAQDQEEATSFLSTAFLAAVFLMLMAMVTQFNSVRQAIIVLSAIVFSTAGVLIGLMVTGRPFGIVMGGVGVIALAGIVVNNNIVLIDSYNEMRERGHAPREAALRAGAQRLRPVLLTSITTVLGLMPMVLALNIDLTGREIQVGSPSTQMWTELSSSIAGGLTFATLLTLILTPCLLVMAGDSEGRIGRIKARLAQLRPRRPGASANQQSMLTPPVSGLRQRR